MAEAAITLKLNPTEYRQLRDSLTARVHDAREQALAIGTESPRLRRELLAEEAALKSILGRI